MTVNNWSRIVILCGAVALAASSAWAETASPPAQPDCKSTASVDSVVLVPRSDLEKPLTEVKNPPVPKPLGNPRVELGDVIDLHVVGLDKVLEEIACRLKQENKEKKLVLFLGGVAIKGSVGTLPGTPDVGRIRYTLTRTSDSKDAWTRILGHPGFDNLTVAVSVGFEDQYPFNSTAKVDFRTLPRCESAIAAVLFFVLLGLFVYLVRKSNILRDDPSIAPVPPTMDAAAPAPADPAPPPAVPAYSLAKTQAAWWFFVIFASYIVISIVTGDYNGAFNSTALILLGIGVAAAVGGAAVNAANKASGDGDKQKDAANAIQAAAADQQKTVKSISDKPEAERSPSEQTVLQQAKDALETNKARYARLANRNDNFVTDILSDANGINLHRFQMVAWTVLLTLIWIKAIWDHLAMPDFDATLLTLQGISAATYVGLKATEPTAPAPAKTPGQK